VDTRLFRHVYNLEYYTPTLWERVKLFFTKKEVHVANCTTITYKAIKDSLYIVSVIHTDHPTIDIGLDPKVGYDEPWRN
jgi:hypothetical protein